MAAGHPPPEIIPLDGPAPIAAPPRPPGAASLTPPSAVAGRPLAEPGAAAGARAGGASAPATSAAVPHGGRFPWAGRGHAFAGYGGAPGGAPNDGIHIAAPN